MPRSALLACKRAASPLRGRYCFLRDAHPGEGRYGLYAALCLLREGQLEEGAAAAAALSAALPREAALLRAAAHLEGGVAGRARDALRALPPGDPLAPAAEGCVLLAAGDAEAAEASARVTRAG